MRGSWWRVCHHLSHPHSRGIFGAEFRGTRSKGTICHTPRNDLKESHADAESSFAFDTLTHSTLTRIAAGTLDGTDCGAEVRRKSRKRTHLLMS